MPGLLRKLTNCSRWWRYSLAVPLVSLGLLSSLVRRALRPLRAEAAAWADDNGLPSPLCSSFSVKYRCILFSYTFCFSCCCCCCRCWLLLLWLLLLLLLYFALFCAVFCFASASRAVWLRVMYKSLWSSAPRSLLFVLYVHCKCVWVCVWLCCCSCYCVVCYCNCCCLLHSSMYQNLQQHQQPALLLLLLQLLLLLFCSLNYTPNYG